MERTISLYKSMVLRDETRDQVYEAEFKVKKDWFENYLQGKLEEEPDDMYCSIDDFLMDYTSDDADEVYEKATKEDALVQDCIITDAC